MFTRNILLLLFMIKTFCLTETSSQPLPGCQGRCGTVTFPYPFGITSNCSAHQTFSITCNTSFNPPRPFITNNNLEVLELSLEGIAGVNNPLLTYNCSGRTDHLDVNFTNTPFTYSSTSTRFTAIGCNNLALISRLTTVIGGCISLCNITVPDTFNNIGYLDPEYFQSSQLTEKSDVYSFGVVLVELLTGQKPITSFSDGETCSLATYFLSAMEENRLFEIVDHRVMIEGGKDQVKRFAELASGCLNLDGKKRSKMKQVAIELELIRTSDEAATS
ncbi:putative protein kinase RLK-Pelle-WAK family [Helianthus anomalus]